MARQPQRGSSLRLSVFAVCLQCQFCRGMPQAQSGATPLPNARLYQGRCDEFAERL